MKSDSIHKCGAILLLVAVIWERGEITLLSVHGNGTNCSPFRCVLVDLLGVSALKRGDLMH